MKLNKKQIDALNIELTIDIAKEDYSEIERKKIADRRRTAEFKGFRKGMVPESLIRRVYGEQILAESVNEVVSKGLGDFIDDNKLRVLGEPLGSENQPEIEWKDGADFSFVFDIATYPEVNVEVAKTDSVNKYAISASAKDKADMVGNLKKYYEDKKENKTDEEIEKEIEERLASEYAQEAEWRLSKDIRDFYVEKTKFDLPEAFIKRWLFSANGGKVSKEQIETEFEGFLSDFRWQLVRSALMTKFGFTVEQKDIEEAAHAFVAYQYAMYGMGNVPEEIIKDAAKNVLSDRKQIDRLVEQVEDQKVIGKLKEEMSIKSKKITSEKFRELK